jgi:hypothetical protein
VEVNDEQLLPKLEFSESAYGGKHN